MLIKNLRNHVTQQLDIITVFREHREGNELEIIEKGDGEKDEDRIKVEGKTLLDKVTVKNLPLDNIWILENEFNHNKFAETLINNQKGAFTAAGKKVEKTILYHHNNRLYVMLIEMKRTISPRRMKEDVLKKYESSLSTLALFLCTHHIIPSFESAEIFPIAVCCYNYYEDTQPTYGNDPSVISGKLRRIYNSGQKEFLFRLDSIALNSFIAPIILCENPNKAPVTNAFEIDFEDILERATSVV